MAWIESHQSLERHPKTLSLAERMGWCVDQTIGKLHRFWWWCLDYAPTGDLTGKSDAVLARCVDLEPKDAKRFVDAMVASCWIDRSDGIFRVHDWLDYAGSYLRDSKFKRSPERWKEAQGLYSDLSADSRQTVGGTNQPDQPNQPTNQPPRARDPTDGLPEPPEALRTPAFITAWEDWRQHRAEKRCKLTPTAARRQLARCEEWGVARAVAAIRYSVAQGYQGLFEERGANGAPRHGGGRAVRTDN